MVRNLWLSGLLLIIGCGYHIGSLTPPDIKTVAIPGFKNQTLYRGFEFNLTRAVVTELNTHSSLRISSLARSDSVLEGTITALQQATIVKDENRLATELDITLSVSINWKDTKNGKEIMPPTVLSETIEVVANRGQDLQSATLLALRKLARAIVYAMENSALLKPKDLQPSKAKGN